MHSKIISLTRLSENYWRLRLAKPVGFNFKAGQYISLLVHPDGHRRTYSISSSPKVQYLELLADVTPMGLGSKYILSLKPNDLIDFIGPMGNFIKKSDGLFLAGGSGIAPYMSMKANPVVWSLRRKSDYFDTGLSPTVFYSRHQLTNYLKTHNSYNNIYLCGSPNYVANNSELLVHTGVNLYIEKFV